MNIPQNRNQNNLEPKITALAITLNEEDNVKRYIQSLSFADEIIFIDSNSTDATVAIAKELGVKVIQRNFDDFPRAYVVVEPRVYSGFPIGRSFTPAYGHECKPSARTFD